MNKKIGVAVLLVLLIIGVVIGYYVKAYSSITVSDAKLQKLSGFSKQGFNVNGKVFIDNPSLVDVSFERIEYNIYLESNNESITTGIVNGDVIDARSVKAVEIEKTINWKPSAELAKELLVKKETFVRVDGIVYLKFWFKDVELEFSKSVNITDYVRLFIIEKVLTDKMIDRGADIVSDIVPGVGDKILIEKGADIIKENKEEIGEGLGNLRKRVFS